MKNIIYFLAILVFQNQGSLSSSPFALSEKYKEGEFQTETFTIRDKVRNSSKERESDAPRNNYSEKKLNSNIVGVNDKENLLVPSIFNVTVWIDANFNGILDSDDQPAQYSNLTINCPGYSSSGITNINGLVTFENAPGSGNASIIITEAPVPNLIFTSAGQIGFTSTNPQHPMINYTISGGDEQIIDLLISKFQHRIRKLSDNNENQHIDSSDLGRPGWNFSLSANGTPGQSYITDQNGYIYVDNLPNSGTLTITENPGTMFLTATSFGYITLPGTVICNLGADTPYEIDILNSNTPECECENSLVGLHWLVPPMNSHGYLHIECGGSYNVLHCNTHYTLTSSGGCTGNCQSIVTNISVSYPNGFVQVGNQSLTFTPVLPGSYACTVQTLCNGQPCPPCQFKLILTENCTPLCTCPDTVSVTGQGIQYNTAVYPANSSATVHLMLDGTGNYTEVRANILDFKLYAKDDQGNPSNACLQCYNNPQSWGSLISGSLGNAANQPLINGTVTSYPGIGVTAATFNPHEIVFSNSGIFSVQNKPLSLNIVLPGASPIACCHLFADVTLKITFRNTDCVECETFVSGTIAISQQNENQLFKIIDPKKIRIKSPSVNNYGINDEGLKRTVAQTNPSVNNYGINDEGLKKTIPKTSVNNYGINDEGLKKEVRNDEDGEPVPGAEIYIELEGDEDPIANVITDENGEFYFETANVPGFPNSGIFTMTVVPIKAFALKKDILVEKHKIKVKFKTPKNGKFQFILFWIPKKNPNKAENKGAFAVSGKNSTKEL